MEQSLIMGLEGSCNFLHGCWMLYLIIGGSPHGDRISDPKCHILISPVIKPHLFSIITEKQSLG